MPKWWAQHAWLGGNANVEGVLIEVKDDRIAAVTPGFEQPPRDSTALWGLTVPGLANAHSHAFHRALRGRTHEQLGSFWSWRDLMYSVADRIDPDGYRKLATAVYAEMALSGFTAVGEFHYLHHQRGGVPYTDPNEMTLALVDAAADAGIRITVIDACYLRGGFDRPLAGAQLRFGDGDASRWMERVADFKPPPHTRAGAAIHSVRAVDASGIAEVAGWATNAGIPLHAHVSEQRAEHAECFRRFGLTPLGMLAEGGAVTQRFTAVHGTHCDDGDVALLGTNGSGCCVCPTTERDLGDGIGPFRKLRDAGVALSIGSDSHALIDGFEEARSIEMGARSEAEERGLFTAESLLEAATAGGMHALGWEAGRLAVGQLADFATVRLDTVRTAGSGPELAATAVFTATAADVSSVVIGGRAVVTDGSHLTVPDAARELSECIGALFS